MGNRTPISTSIESNDATVANASSPEVAPIKKTPGSDIATGVVLRGNLGIERPKASSSDAPHCVSARINPAASVHQPFVMALAVLRTGLKMLNPPVVGGSDGESSSPRPPRTGLFLTV